jgi:hypothetical protein
MNTATPALKTHSNAITIIGLLTLGLGILYTGAGASLLFGAAAIANDPAGGWWPMLQPLAGLLSIVGIVLLVQGILTGIAGVGVMQYQRWALVLTLILAVPTILWGVLLLTSEELDVSSVAIGVGQIVYGIAAIGILSTRGGAFSPTAVR